MKKGRREIHKTDNAALPVEAPGELITASEVHAWSRLRADLVRSGFTQRCDLQIVILACRRMARIERIVREVDGLPSLVIEGGRLHPLVAELRNLETGLLAALGSLHLTPRARSSSRAKGNEMNQAVGDVDPEVARLLALMP